MGTLGKAVGQTFETVREAVVKPVTEEVGKAIEQGVQTTVYGPAPLTQDPKIQEQKKVEEEKRKSWALRVIDWYKKIDENIARVREQKKQQEQSRLQQQKEETQIKQFKVEEKKKQESIAITQAKNKTEVKGGLGG